MPDENKPFEAESGDDGFEVPFVVRVVVSCLLVPGRIAVSAQVHREYLVGVGDRGREVFPDMRFIAKAVHKQDRHALATPLE
jgi:hypothetical protein